jgi:putative transcriptional regulator
MSKTDFDRIIAGLNDAVAIAKGEADATTYRVHVPSTVDVRAIRKAMGMTQDAFAARYGFSLGAVRDWEQGRKQPEASARILLKVIEKRPDAVDEALNAA